MENNFIRSEFICYKVGIYIENNVARSEFIWKFWNAKQNGGSDE